MDKGKKSQRTAEQRARQNEYLRNYRASHPEKTRAWRDAYILRRAARLLAERAALTGGDGGGA